MPILLNQGAERLHQVPGRRIDLRLETRMNVLLRTTSPLFTAGHEFQFDDTLRTKCDLEAAIGILIGARQQHAHTGLQCLEDIWGHYNFAEMWRADFLFPLANEYQVDRQLFTGRIERHQGAQKRILRTLLVHRTASHADRSELFFGYQSAFQWRRAPLICHELFDVIHEVDGESGRGAGVQPAKNTRLPRGWYQPHVRKARLSSQIRHVFGALRIIAIFRCDRWKRDPFLQPLDVLGMHLRNLSEYRLFI